MYRVELRTGVQQTQHALAEGRFADAEHLSRELVTRAESWLEAEHCAAQVNRAHVLLANGHVAEAATLAQRVITTRDNPRNRRRHESQLLTAWALQGQIALREHNPTAAREPLRLAYDGFVHHRMWAEATGTLEHRLRAELAIGDHAAAAQMARLLALTREEEGHLDLAAAAWTLSGTEAVEAGILLDAQDALLRAIAIYADAGPLVLDAVVCLAELTVALHRADRVEEADQFWAEAQRALPLLADPLDRAKASVTVGYAGIRTGRYNEARTMLRPHVGVALDPADDAYRRRYLGEALAFTGAAAAGRVELEHALTALEEQGQFAELNRTRALLILLTPRT
ncbi:hypothetical protein [Kribbia dieselivorans]|uniref:hypothetical protein n=1 Tax=Kribbia dieselivorans TaxID=331526 RepID=UPI000838A83D|nr:hypothetical protein [Kribbia dieselivorans]